MAEVRCRPQISRGRAGTLAPPLERGCETVKVWSAWSAPQMPQQLRCREVSLHMFVSVCDRPLVAELMEAQDRAVMETKSATIH